MASTRSTADGSAWPHSIAAILTAWSRPSLPYCKQQRSKSAACGHFVAEIACQLPVNTSEYGLYVYTVRFFLSLSLRGTMSLKLTARQQEILNLIKAAVDRTGFPPTRAEIAAALGFKSPNAAEDHLRALARKGAITLT